MTHETWKTWCWTGGVTAAMVAIVVVLWYVGVFDAPIVTVAQ